MRKAIHLMAILACLVAPDRCARGQIVADHHAIEQFDLIPEAALQAAAARRFMFRHASVGGTIDSALDCLQGTRDHPEQCTAYVDYAYDRRNWDFQARGNSGWYGKVDDFVAETELQLDDFDAFAFKYCYLDGLDGLQEPCGSTFDTASVSRAWEYLRTNLEALEAAHPDKVFIWWTIPLTQIGQRCTEALNEQIRSYARSEGKILFDIADIECHDDLQNRATNAEGWEIAVKEFCGEQKPDAAACHPNWAGSLRLSMVLWWLMARVSGWDGATADEPFVRGDANADSAMDISDAVALLSHLFIGDPPPSCRDAGDANDDGALDIADAVSILLCLFAVVGPLAEPFEGCGADPTADATGCASFPACR